MSSKERIVPASIPRPSGLEGARDQRPNHGVYQSAHSRVCNNWNVYWLSQLTQYHDKGRTRELRTQFLASLEHAVSLNVEGPCRILHFNGSNRMDLVRATDRLGAAPDFTHPHSFSVCVPLGGRRSKQKKGRGTYSDNPVRRVAASFSSVGLAQ
jgi:hypothetical protein